MKIGILSDSHGQLQRLRAAVEALRAAGAEVLVHCGDVGSAECLAALAAAGLPCYAVIGNMDLHLNGLADLAAGCGVYLDARMVTVPLGDGRTLAATHGNDGRLLRQLVAGGAHAYVCHGHTHKLSDARQGAVRVINPGALHHARSHTAVLLDTSTDELKVLTL